jgi:hypothetical protein
MNSYFSRYQIQFTLLVSDITSSCISNCCYWTNQWLYYWNWEHSLLQLWNELVLLCTLDVCNVTWDHSPPNHSPDISRRKQTNSILNTWLANWQVYLDSGGGSGYNQPQSSLEFVKSVDIFSHIIGPQGCTCSPANIQQRKLIANNLMQHLQTQVTKR